MVWIRIMVWVRFMVRGSFWDSVKVRVRVRVRVKLSVRLYSLFSINFH